MSASFRLFVDGDTEICYTQGSLRATSQIGERGTANASLMIAGPKPFDAGDIVTITRADGTTVIWVGVIDKVNQKVLLDQLQTSEYNLTLVSIEAWASRRRYSEAFTDIELDDLITDIVATTLTDLGISVGTVADVGEIAEFKAQLESVDDILRRICDKYGLIWYIDPATLELNIVERDAVTAPFDIIEDVDGGTWSNMSIDEETGGYFNRIHVAGWSVTDPRTEEFGGDGGRRTFNLSLPVALKPVVEVNGEAKTVGIGGLDTGRDWYWNKGQTEITQDESGTILKAGYEDILSPFASIDVPLTLISGVHIWNDYLVVAFSDPNGGYVLYKRNGSAWDQVNNLSVFSSRRVNRIVGIGSYFLGYEGYGIDGIDTMLYQIIGDAIVEIATVATATAFSQRIYIGVSSRHLAYNHATFGNQEFEADIIADDGTLTSATGTDDGKSVAYRYFLGYQNGYAFIADNASPTVAGATLRQLAITVNDYAITTNPTNLTGDFISFASTEGYAFFLTDDGVEWYKRTGATSALTKLTTLDEPIGYTFTKVAVYDDWLLVGVAESPYMLVWRINRDTDTLVYHGALDLGLGSAPSYIVPFAGGFFAAENADTGIGGAYTKSIASGTGIGGDVLSVTYRGLFRDLHTGESPDEISTRAAQSGGSGIYETGATLGQDRAGEMVDYATAQLQRYAQFMRRIRYSTRTDGLLPGQLQTINLPTHNIEGVFLIERITHQHQAGSLHFTQVEGVIGGDLASWQNYFRQLTGAGQGLDLGAGESVIIPAGPANEAVLLTEVIAADESDPDPVIGEFIIGLDEIQGEE